jgi:hypothetical protein
MTFGRNLKRRLALVALAGTLLAGGAVLGTSPAQAKNDTWACVGIEHVNLGVCQGNPLPGGPLVPLPKP